MSSWETVVISGQPWTLGPQIGAGGFGQVYSAESHGRWCAIKLVPKDRNAGRDLLFADDLRGAKNIIPILGTGASETHWALLMPRADRSLREYLMEAGRSLEEAEALPVLIDVARALVSLSGIRVVHRDLKPENILLYNGAWCLSDFGISRYADATTATETWKRSTTRPYAAPEQWREETATAATDIYALGVVSHELLTGGRPFRGPGPEDLRRQHLHEDPPPVTTVGPALAALVESCLFKPPGARPTPHRLLDRLESLETNRPLDRGLRALQQANLAATSHLAREARAQSWARSEEERRTALGPAALRQIEQISGDVKKAISSEISAAHLGYEEFGWQLTLPNAGMSFQYLPPRIPVLGEALLLPAYIPEEYLTPYLGVDSDRQEDPLPFDVITHGTIAVAGSRDDHGYAGRAHSLWFCDAEEEGRYGWYELGFLDRLPVPDDVKDRNGDNYIRGNASTFGIYAPNAIAPDDPMAAQALNGSDKTFVIAWPPTLLEPGNLDDFISRWAEWLASASRGHVRRVSSTKIHHPRSPRGSSHRAGRTGRGTVGRLLDSFRKPTPNP